MAHKKQDWTPCCRNTNKACSLADVHRCQNIFLLLGPSLEILAHGSWLFQLQFIIKTMQRTCKTLRYFRNGKSLYISMSPWKHFLCPHWKSFTKEVDIPMQVPLTSDFIHRDLTKKCFWTVNCWSFFQPHVILKLWPFSIIHKCDSQKCKFSKLNHTVLLCDSHIVNRHYFHVKKAS